MMRQPQIFVPKDVCPSSRLRVRKYILMREGKDETLSEHLTVRCHFHRHFGVLLKEQKIGRLAIKHLA